MSQRFVILDGSSLMYRAFYALPPLTDSQGRPTNAIFGFSNMLTKLLTELQPDKCDFWFFQYAHEAAYGITAG